MDEPKCTICLERFKNPVALDCKHSFCFQCLHSAVLANRSVSHHLCPLCRTEYLKAEPNPRVLICPGVVKGLRDSGGLLFKASLLVIVALVSHLARTGDAGIFSCLGLELAARTRSLPLLAVCYMLLRYFFYVDVMVLLLFVIIKLVMSASNTINQTCALYFHHSRNH